MRNHREVALPQTLDQRLDRRTEQDWLNVPQSGLATGSLQDRSAVLDQDHLGLSG